MPSTLISSIVILILVSCSQKPIKHPQGREISSVYSKTAQSILKSNIKKFKRCSPSKKNLKETYTLHLSIDENGDVQSLNTVGTNLKISKCLNSIARDIKFPNSPFMGAVELSQPLNF